MSKKKTYPGNFPPSPPAPPGPPPGLIMPPGGSWPPPVGEIERHGSYAYPITLPTRLDWNPAKERFDNDWDVFMVPRGSLITPDDQFRAGRRAYSYRWDNWWSQAGVAGQELANLLAAVNAPNHTPLNMRLRLHRVWRRITEHAAHQPATISHRQAPQRILDFYVFDWPIVADVLVKKIDTATPYTAYRITATNAWFLTRLVKG